MSDIKHLTDSALPEMELNIRDVLCTLGKDANLDRYSINYCIRRFYKEGFSFLSRVLPKFSKNVLSSLEKGRLNIPLGFSLDSRGFPRLFARQLADIFEYPSGYLKPVPNPTSLHEIRMFCEAFYKTDIPFSQDQLLDATIKYVELEVKNRETSLEDVRHLESIANHIRWACEGFGPLIDELAGNCRFGPGANSDISVSRLIRELVGSRQRVKTLSPTLRKMLNGKTVCHPLAKRLLPLISGFCHEYSRRWFGRCFVRGVPSRVSKVLFVPKDSRGPRTISSEPSSLSWVQMGFFDAFTSHLERATSGRINFTDQGKNQFLAFRGSVEACDTRINEYAPCTGDLQDASDLVTTSKVSRLFARTKLHDFLLSARSTHTNLHIPGIASVLKALVPMVDSFMSVFANSLYLLQGNCKQLGYTSLSFICGRLRSLFERSKFIEILVRLLRGLVRVGASFVSGDTVTFVLSKFGGMGSGLTFPIMALIIWATCVDVLVRIYNVPRSKARSLVYVYGDDFIVPAKYFRSCLRGLERIGLKVNWQKSFSRDFKESCGHDYYRGVNVTPQMIRLTGCDSRYDDASRSIKPERRVLFLYKLTKLAHEYDEKGYLHTCSYLSNYARELVRLISPSTTFPYVAKGSTILGTYSKDPLKMNDVFGYVEYDNSGMGRINNVCLFRNAHLPFPNNVGHGSEWLYYHSLPQCDHPISSTDQTKTLAGFSLGAGCANTLDHLFPQPNSRTSFNSRGEFILSLVDVSHMSVT